MFVLINDRKAFVIKGKTWSKNLCRLENLFLHNNIPGLRSLIKSFTIVFKSLNSFYSFNKTLDDFINKL